MRPEREGHLVYLYHDKGLSLQAIGTRYGVTRQRVHQWFEKLSIPRRQQTSKLHHIRTPKTLRLIRTRYAEGLSAAQIAAELRQTLHVPVTAMALDSCRVLLYNRNVSVTSYTIRRWLRQCGVQMRNRAQTLAEKGR